MSKRAVVALDVGGTDVGAACISQDRALIGEVLESASPSPGTKEEIVAELARAIAAARAQAGDFTVTGCAIAIPAPFDYAAGVSHMEHKFRAINGLSLGRLLQELSGLPTSFLNDADAFGLGVSCRQLPEVKRLVALTIGTGLGAGFVADGRIATDPDTVPPGGEVWDLPYAGGIIEDYVSGRAVVAAYQRLSAGARPEAGEQPSAGPATAGTAKDVADLASRGNAAAVQAYQAMGAALGHGLAPVLLRFRPEALVIGGKVAGSLPIFGPAVSEALAADGLPDLPVIPAADGNLALWGAAEHLLTR
jgi:glucokinase